MNGLIQLYMKIPLNTTNDLYEIELSHAQAVEMANENVAWQASGYVFR